MVLNLPQQVADGLLPADWCPVVSLEWRITGVVVVTVAYYLFWMLVRAAWRALEKID